MLRNDFENYNFEMFDRVVHNFGKSDNDLIYFKVLSSNTSRLEAHALCRLFLIAYEGDFRSLCKVWTF